MDAREQGCCLYVAVSLRDDDIGGWGAVIVANGERRELSGVDLNTSTDRLGLHAIIAGLRAAELTMPLSIVTDNQRLHRGLTDHLYVWQRNGWLARNGRNIRHHELWQQVLDYAQTREITSSLRAEPSDAIFIARAKRLAYRATQTRARMTG